MTAFAWACARLLRRAPATYRDRFGDEIVALASARIADERGWRRLRRAIRELWDLSSAVRRERRRDQPASGSPWGSDLRSAARQIGRRPAAALALTAILTAGIAASTFGFTLLSSVLLRPLPYGDPDQLVMLWSFVPQVPFGEPDQPLSGGRVVDLRKTMANAAAIEAFRAEVFNLDADGASSERIDGVLTTASLFDTLRLRPAVGRFFSPGDDVRGAPCVAVIGFGLWQRDFGGRASIAGTAVRLNGGACTIAGVAPRGFDFPRGGEMPPGFQYPSRTEMWVASPPIHPAPADLTVIARLRPGATPAMAQAELDTQTIERDAKEPRSKGWNRIRVEPMRRQAVPSAIVTTVAALFGAVLMLLLVASGNAAQLALVGSLGRRQDFSVRAALGASASDLARLIAMESAILTVAAGMAGAGLAVAGVRFVRAFGPQRFPRLAEVAMDGRTFTFLAIATLIGGLIMASGPIWIARRAAGGDLQVRERATSDPLRRWRAGLIGTQVALAVLLAASSGLLVRSFIERLSVPIGFDPHHVLAFEVTLPPSEYPETFGGGAKPSERPAIVAAIDALLDRLNAIPGVVAAGMGKPLPMSGSQEATVLAYDGMSKPRSAADVPIAEIIVVSPGLFRALGTPLLAGREFTVADSATAENTVIVNDSLAKRYWPGASALGHRLRVGNSPWMTVVGVVPEMKRYRLDDPPGPAFYPVHTQGAYPSLSTLPFVVRSAGSNPLDLLPAVRAAAIDAGLHVPIAKVTSMDAVVATMSADARFATRLMLAIAGAAVLLTMAGLYGTVAFAVSRRRRELGIRLALGAAPRSVVRLVVRDGARPALVGALAGLPAAAGAGALMRGLLFGISPADPWTFGLVPAVLALVAMAACLAPARRATSIDPKETLRGD